MRKFLLQSKNTERDSYLWNTMGSLLIAFQPVVMLMILTRTLGLKDAGVLTIAYANANLFLTIGKYGMRNFQVSDIKEQFSFYQYEISRFITSVLMITISACYVLYMHNRNSYTEEKSLTIIWMCLLKGIDAIEDVFHGFYQQKERLDVAGKALAIRMTITIVVFGLGLIILRNLLQALIIATIVSFVIFLLFTNWTYAYFRNKKEALNWKAVFMLLKICFPLFLGAFLLFYIGNAPKYAIDNVLTDELQACYGFIAMPVFVIELLNGFIFNPMLHKMSVFWQERKMKLFVVNILIQIGIIVVITMVCILGAYICGVPILSWMYHTDLAPYKTELLILLLGGGFLGLSGFLAAINTIIREQRKLMHGYLIIAAFAYFFSDKIVASYQIFGAAVLYTMLMAVLSLLFGLLVCYGVMKNKKIGSFEHK